MLTSFTRQLSIGKVLHSANLICGVVLMLALASCARQGHWHNTDVSGSLPDLAFDMIRAKDGKRVTGADYRSKVILLYFGYTYCPDACPTTLSNIGHVLRSLGPKASAVRVLFVTVDPERDSLPILTEYERAFGHQIDALRGDQNALAALARRYRIAYSVTPAGPGQPYTVTHSSAVYVFDRTGAPRLLISSLSTDQSDLVGTAQDLGQLIQTNG